MFKHDSAYNNDFRYFIPTTHFAVIEKLRQNLNSIKSLMSEGRITCMCLSVQICLEMVQLFRFSEKHNQPRTMTPWFTLKAKSDEWCDVLPKSPAWDPNNGQVHFHDLCDSYRVHILAQWHLSANWISLIGEFVCSLMHSKIIPFPAHLIGWQLKPHN